MGRATAFAVLMAGLAGVSAFTPLHRPPTFTRPIALKKPVGASHAPFYPFTSEPRSPLRLQATVEDDDDLPARAIDFMTKSAAFLNNDVRVPSFLVPGRPSEKGSQTTLKGWYLFASGVSLTFGNVLFPTSFLGFLYVSRPVEAPDFAAAVAAVLTTAVVSPLFSSLGDALEADDWPLARVPLVLGLVGTSWLLREVSKEGQKAFVEPKRAAKDPQVKSQRDLKFFDVKLQSGGSGPAEKKTVVVMSDKKKDPAPQPKAAPTEPAKPTATAKVVPTEEARKPREEERSGSSRWR